jgi:glycosyltransferase 2 family protein
LFQLVRLVLAAAIVGAVGWRLATEWGATPMPALRPAPWELAAAAACGAAGLVGLALLFVAALSALGVYKRQHLAWHLRTWFQGYFYRYVPGKVMVVVERARLGEQAGIPKSTSVLLVVWETLLLLAGACVLAVAGLGVVPLGPQLPPGSIAVATAAALGMVFAFPFALRLLVKWSDRAKRLIPPAVLTVPARTQALLVLGYSGVWLLLGASFAFTCRAFEGGESAGLVVLFWFVLSYVAGLVLSVTPAGLGVREGLLVAGLSGIFPAATGLAFALASRVLMTAVEALLVLAATRVQAPPE